MLVDYSVCRLAPLDIIEKAMIAFECKIEDDTVWTYKHLEYDEDFESFDILAGSDEKGTARQIIEEFENGYGVAVFFPGYYARAVRDIILVLGRSPHNATHLYLWIEDFKPPPYTQPMPLRHEFMRPFRIVAERLELPAMVAVRAERRWPIIPFDKLQTFDDFKLEYGQETAITFLMARDERFNHLFGAPSVIDIDGWHIWYPLD
ncbi:MAG: hypothetical protein AAFY56_08045 [Pseudomonadota bacterium]